MAGRARSVIEHNGPMNYYVLSLIRCQAQWYSSDAQTLPACLIRSVSIMIILVVEETKNKQDRVVVMKV